MSEILLYYKRPDPTTWVYMSSFLTIGLFFVFRRFWSIRNLDIVLLILLAPGLLMVYEGRRLQMVETEATAYRELLRKNQQPNPSNSATGINGLSSLIRALPIFALVQTETPLQAGATNEAAATEQAATEQANTEQAGDETVEDDLNGEAGPTDSLEAAASNPQANAGDAATGDTSQRKALIAPLDENETLESVTEPLDAMPSDIEPLDIEGEVVRRRYAPRDIQRWGFIYLFVVESLILIRLMLDPLMVRRPLLDPNLTTGGLNFIGIWLFIFMMANVVASNPRVQAQQGPELGPGYPMMNMLPAIPTRPVSDQPGGANAPEKTDDADPEVSLAGIAKILAILAQLAIVCGIVLISNRHFGNTRAGVGCATLYLLLPYTAQMTGRVDHALPVALLLWAVLSYRRPLLSGIFLGLAGGLVYYPLFLLPLWFSFYWQRGAKKFAIGVLAMLALLTLALWFDNSGSLIGHLKMMFGLLNPNREPQDYQGIWALGWNPIWRLPVIVAFVILSAFFAIWPAQKNLGTLISGSAALMVAAQFWHGNGGGLYIAWFLPLLLLTIFRPNLQDRVATKVVAGPSRSEPGTRSELKPV